MDIELDWPRLKAIFTPRQDILDGIGRCADTPGKKALFNEMAKHVETKLQAQAASEPDSKRRKIQADGPANGASAGNASDEEVLLQIKEISVSVPQRKKFELCMTSGYLYAQATGTTGPVPGMAYSWSDIEYVFYLPIPEKAQVQHNYILFPRGSYLPARGTTAGSEPLVFTVPATAPKDGTIAGTEAGSAASVSDTYKSLFHWALGRRLKAAGNDVKIVSADPSKFQSVIRQAHRPNEKAVHVNGFRGSKDGFVFFLENGILWGFKKPLIFIPLHRISSVSYTNILQITFNIVVEAFMDEGNETEELEFGMLDQQDYNGIDNYVRQNGLQDGSMAEQRKAKLQLAENRGKKGEDGEAGDMKMEEATELEKAQQEAEQMQDDDDDDEEEEDFDPGSEGDSEGSGSSSEEEDEGEGGGDDDGEINEDEEVEPEEEDEDDVKDEDDDGPGLSIRQN